jgi:diguanylate cyclase (GGDEF)-like protein
LGDILARYGGEEFVIILPETDLDGAKVLASRILKKISKKPYAKSGKEVFYTISIGLAVYDSVSPVSKNELIGLADSALYTAKKSGKDRLETFVK